MNHSLSFDIDLLSFLAQEMSIDCVLKVNFMLYIENMDLQLQLLYGKKKMLFNYLTF